MKNKSEMIEEIIKLRHNGATFGQIGKKLGICHFSACKYYTNYKHKYNIPITVKPVALASLPKDDLTQPKGVPFLSTNSNQCTWPYGRYNGIHWCCGELKTNHKSYCDTHAVISRGKPQC